MSLLINPYRFASSYDTDAQAFFTAAGITDTTQKNAVNQLVLDLKSYSIWSKMSAIYPFVGGDATKHSYNLKNTAQFQITWSGTVTHDSNGITPNGTTSDYGDTGLNASTVLSLNDVHLSVYSRTNSAAAQGEIGAVVSTSQIIGIYCKWTDNKAYADCWHTPSDEIAVTVTNSQGLFCLSRRSSTDFEFYQNGASIGTDTTSVTGTRPNANINIGRSGSGGSGTTRNLAFASIGSGLTDTEASNFSTAVESFQDALSRGVV